MELLGGGLRVVEVAEHRQRVMAVDGDLADRVHDWLAVVVEHGNDRSWQRAPDRAGLWWEHVRAAAADAVELGLPVGVVDRTAKEPFGPAEQIIAERLAAGDDRAEVEVSAGQISGADDPQRGRGDERQGDVVLAHQPHGPLGVERTVEIDDHRQAVEPGGDEDVHQPGDPRPVGRRPQHVVGLREEVIDLLERGHLTKHDPLGVEDALWIAGRTGGVDQERRILGARRHRGELIRCRFDGAPERGLAGKRIAADDHHRQRTGTVGKRLAHLRRVRSRRDHRLRLRVAQPVPQRVGAEQRRQRERDRSHPEQAHVGDARLERLRVDDSDDVAAADAQPDHHVGKPVGGIAHVAEGVVARRSVRRDDRRGARRRVVIVDARHAEVELSRDLQLPVVDLPPQIFVVRHRLQHRLSHRPLLAQGLVTSYRDGGASDGGTYCSSRVSAIRERELVGARCRRSSPIGENVETFWIVAVWPATTFANRGTRT